MSSKHGGLRLGAGAKPKDPEEKNVPHALTVPGRIKNWLIEYKNRTGKSKNAFIVEAIEEKIEREGSQITEKREG